MRSESQKNWAMGTAGETDAEWIARGGHLTAKKGFDAIDFGVKKLIHGWLDPHKAHIPEMDFWTSFFAITVDDALGFDPASKRRCATCHAEECTYVTTYKKHNFNSKYCDWVPHTIQQCALNYINGPMAEEDCQLLGIEVSYLRRLLAQAKKRPTIIRNMKNISVVEAK